MPEEIKSGSVVGDIYNIGIKIPKEGYLIAGAIGIYFVYRIYFAKKKWDILREKARKVIGLMAHLKSMKEVKEAYQDMEATFNKYKPDAKKLLQINITDIAGLAVLNEIFKYKGERLSCAEALIECYTAYCLYQCYSLGYKIGEAIKNVVLTSTSVLKSFIKDMPQESWNWYIDGFRKQYGVVPSENLLKKDILYHYKKGTLGQYLRRAKRRYMRHKFQDPYWDCKYSKYEDMWQFPNGAILNKLQLDTFLSANLTLPRIRGLLS